jgi:hypothetical protein
MENKSDDIDLPKGTVAEENTVIVDPLEVVSNDLVQFTETKATVSGVYDCLVSGKQPHLVIAESESQATDMLLLWYGRDVKFTIAESTRHPMLGEDVIIKMKTTDSLTMRPWQGSNKERGTA